MYNIVSLRESVQFFCPVPAIDIDHFDLSLALFHVAFNLDHQAGKNQLLMGINELFRTRQVKGTSYKM